MTGFKSVDQLVASLALHFENQSQGLSQVVLMATPVISNAQASTCPVKQWFDDYVQGSQRCFETQFFAPITFVSSFRRQVWEQVSLIPFGETRTYSDIALAIGNPRAVRAVGTAIGKNPCMLARPCHRVIGSQGNLGGFAFGLDVKRLLLRHEGLLFK